VAGSRLFDTGAEPLVARQKLPPSRAQALFVKKITI